MSVEYYTHKSPVTDLSYIGAFTAMIEEAITEALGNSPKITTRTITFVGKTGIGSQIINDSLDIIINGENNTVTIQGSIIDLTAQAAMALAAEALITSGLAISGIPSASAITGVIAIGATALLYSNYIEPTVDKIIDLIQHPAKTDLRLINANGAYVGGA